MHLSYLFIYLCALGPIDATINHCHTKFLTLRETELRVCVVPLHYGRVGRMRARQKMKLWYCLFRLLDPQKPVTGCREAGKNCQFEGVSTLPVLFKSIIQPENAQLLFGLVWISFFNARIKVWWDNRPICVFNRPHLATAILPMQILNR